LQGFNGRKRTQSKPKELLVIRPLPDSLTEDAFHRILGQSKHSKRVRAAQLALFKAAQEGRTLTDKEVQESANLSSERRAREAKATFQLCVNTFSATESILTETPPKAWATLPMAQKLERFKRSELSRLNRDFNARVEEMATTLIEQQTLPHLLGVAKRSNQKLVEVLNLLRRRTEIIPRSVFRTLWAAVHPDRTPERLRDTHDQAFHWLSEHRAILLAEEEALPGGLKRLPETAEELRTFLSQRSAA
jgi:hypothetical protein